MYGPGAGGGGGGGRATHIKQMGMLVVSLWSVDSANLSLSIDSVPGQYFKLRRSSLESHTKKNATELIFSSFNDRFQTVTNSCISFSIPQSEPDLIHAQEVALIACCALDVKNTEPDTRSKEHYVEILCWISS